MGDDEKFCTECGKPIKKDAKFCAECGTSVDETENDEIKQETVEKEEIKVEESNVDQTSQSTQDTKEIKYHKNPILAAILSLIFCLGQFYNGQILKGILFIIIYVIVVRINIWLGIIFLIYAAYDGYKNAKYINNNNGNYFYNSKNKEAI